MYFAQGRELPRAGGAGTWRANCPSLMNKVNGPGVLRYNKAGKSGMCFVVDIPDALYFFSVHFIYLPK